MVAADRQSKKWRARAFPQGKTKCIGSFNTEEEANEERLKYLERTRELTSA